MTVWVWVTVKAEPALNPLVFSMILFCFSLDFGFQIGPRSIVLTGLELPL